MKGLVVEGESFSIGLTLAAHSDYEHVGYYPSQKECSTSVQGNKGNMNFSWILWA